MTTSNNTPTADIVTPPELQAQPFDWGALLDIHPAATLFPLMPEAEHKELAEDIRVNGLRAPIIVWSPTDGSKKPVLLDGVNRLDALTRLGLLYRTEDGHIGLKTWTGTKWAEQSGDRIKFEHVVGGDPYALALSYNVHRRHLDAERKRDLIVKVLKARPEVSNRQIAAGLKVDHHKVAEVRRGGEATGEISPVQKTRGKDGKARPARKQTSARKTAPKVKKSALEPIIYDLSRLRVAIEEIEVQAAAGNKTRLRQALEALRCETAIALEADSIIAAPVALP